MWSHLLLKMCLAINLEDKAQDIEGSKGWRFAFEEEDWNKKYRGLVILTPSRWATCLRRKSLETVKRGYPKCFRTVDVSAIYGAIGLSANYLAEASLSIKREAHSGSDSDSLLNLCQIWEKRCKACDNCKKDDCGQCQTCVQARGSAKTKSCLRRVRLKALHALIFRIRRVLNSVKPLLLVLLPPFREEQSSEG
jgi:hypothetical protein